MPGELEKICAMLEDGSAELQCAAAVVLGELKPKEPAARKALAKALKAPNDQVKLYAMEALARIDPEGSVKELGPLLGAPEPVRGKAKALLFAAGPAAAKALREHLGADDPQVRKGVLEILGQLKEGEGEDALFAGLLDRDLEVVRKAAQAYRQRTESMSPSEKAAALKKVLAFLESPKVQKAKTPIASCLLILGSLKDPSAAKAVLKYVDRKQPPAARNHALLALANLPVEGASAKAVAARLVPLLDEEDFNAIVKPALDVLWKLPAGKEQAERAFKLLKSPHGPVRPYAVRVLGAVGGGKAGQALLEALGGDDPRLVDQAGQALRSNPDFAPLLLKALDREEDVQAQWKLVNVLRAYKNVLDKGSVRSLLGRGLALLARKQSGFQAYFEVVRAAAPDLLRETLLKKGRELLAKGKVEDAERHLRLLERDDLATPEGEFALAAAQLRLQQLDVTGAGRDRGPALALFSKLSRREGFPFLKHLEKNAGLVTPEGLLYLGFALVERQGAERDAGAGVLKLVARKYGSKEPGKIARQKLKTQGAG
jgi:HEAT repeat protein